MKSNGNTIFVREIHCPQCNRVTKNWIKMWKTEHKKDGLYVIAKRVCFRCSDGIPDFKPMDFMLKVDIWNQLIRFP